MVRVEERVRDELPRNVPRQVLLINEDAHELNDAQRGVRIIKLDRDICAKNSEQRRAPGTRCIDTAHCRGTP